MLVLDNTSCARNFETAWSQCNKIKDSLSFSHIYIIHCVSVPLCSLKPYPLIRAELDVQLALSDLRRFHCGLTEIAL